MRRFGSAFEFAVNIATAGHRLHGLQTNQGLTRSLTHRRDLTGQGMDEFVNGLWNRQTLFQDGICGHQVPH
ncbi:MAG: hypothetical protein GY809_02110 [Planctomycetes bacterium]|nr:hypothetical protein [Planctomycetota bacterium]